MLVTAGDFTYASVTGSELTWGVVEYWILNFGSTSGVLYSETTIKRVIWIAIPIITLIIGILVPKLRSVKSRVTRNPYVPMGKSLGLLGVSLAGIAGFIVVLLAGNGFSPRTRCAAFEVLSGLVSRIGAEKPPVEVLEGGRFDDVWEFERQPPDRRYNVVVVIFESLSWKQTDVYMESRGTTPFLGALAKQSLVVSHFYTVLPHTTKALIPILAGYYPYLDREPKEAKPGILPRKSLAYILGDQGYVTAFFQTANDFERRSHLIGNMGYSSFNNLFTMPQSGFEEVNYFGKEEKMMLEPSMEWVDQHREEPFFITYLTLSSHHPYWGPASYPKKDFGVANKLFNDYLNAIKYTDEFVQLLMESYEKRGLLGNTLFIIMGDHGEAFGEHGGWQHDQILWEEGLRTMAILYGPGLLPESDTIEGTRSILDIVPTVCDVLGIRLLKGKFLGQSLLKPAAENRKLYFSGCSRGECLAMREGPVKTIYYFGKRPMEVFDNAQDPFDTKNLAEKAPYGSAFLAARKKEMLQWAAMTNLQYLRWEKEAKERTGRH